MRFGQAIDKLITGTDSCKGIRRCCWEHNVVIRKQTPDKHSKMTHPYLYVESRFGTVPWKETMVEMFESDWEIVYE